MRVPVAVVDFVYLPSVLTATGKTIEAITALPVDGFLYSGRIIKHIPAPLQDDRE